MKNKSYANRGMKLESLISKTNDYYRENNIADIRKVPTAFKVLRTYEKNKSLKVGHLMAGEWLDFCGVKDGKFIIFDAKQTKGKSIPLSNIKEHQMESLESFDLNKGDAFIIIYFSDLERYFKVNYKQLKFIIDYEIGKMKSVNYKILESYNCEIHIENGILKYL